MHRREFVIGHTVLGRPIEAIHFTPRRARLRSPALPLGAIHGDEAVTQLMLSGCRELIDARRARPGSPASTST
jgi:hypothetical protein